jgi:hypothetical protein
MKFKYFKDRHNGKLHMWNRHKMTRAEVEKAFPHSKGEYKDGNAFVRTCQAPMASKMEIVYLKNPDHYFIITAYYL